MNSEDQIADIFERVARDLEPAAGDVIARGEHLGRRLRTRHRARLALGNCALVLIVAGIGLAATVLRPAPATAPASAPAGRTGTAASSGGSAAPLPSRSAAARKPKAPIRKPVVGRVMTSRQMLATLRSLLPPGSTTSDLRHDMGPGALEVDYNDGKGAVDLIIAVTRTWTSPPLDCPRPLWTDEGTRPAGALPVSCVMRTLSDGSIERDAVMNADEFGFYGYDIYDLRPNGVTVFIQVGNGINHTLPRVDRARPPGSMAQWESVVQSPAWHL